MSLGISPSERQWSGETAAQLRNLGYRQISRKFGTVARPDVEDVRQFFRREEPYSGLAQADTDYKAALSLYCRCHTKDTITGVPDHIMNELRWMVGTW